MAPSAVAILPHAASASPAASAAAASSAATHLNSRPAFVRSLRRSALAVSTPDLSSVYLAQSKLLTPGLSHKASLAALTQSSLASIPDVSESYALDSVLSDTSQTMTPTPGTPARPAGDDVAVGDDVDVPGGMHGVVRFLGSVQGKKGTFAGVELHPEFASRGKNSGDVDGISYFSTDVPGAGIFVPATKAMPRNSAFNASMRTSSTTTPTTSGARQVSSCSKFTLSTPAFSKLSTSVGPGTRAVSPQGKRVRTSLPRPDSPVRRIQVTPGPQPSNINPPSRGSQRFGSPTATRFAQSVCGTSGDPNKKATQSDRKPSYKSRSASALGSAALFDDETTLVDDQRAPTTNGGGGSITPFNAKTRRPASRAQAANDDETDRLRSQLEEKDRQLKEQASTLADMESSLAELQSLIEQADDRKTEKSMDDKDTAQLRHILREKNDRIAMLTAEFDAHRVDFRSTIDTLELASTETERVYEKRIEELVGEIRDLESRCLDVDSVASQLKQLEELVQELEEGLEDARRGEAEARGEAEFLRGEVERTRSELRRERDNPGPTSPPLADQARYAKELQEKEAEIRGLKAIINSLSRDAGPDARTKAPAQASNGSAALGGEPAGSSTPREDLERQIVELQALLKRQTDEDKMMEQRSGSFQTSNVALHTNAGPTAGDAHDPGLDQDPRYDTASSAKAKASERLHDRNDFSPVQEKNTLWCEMCEAHGHDILTCTNMFGSNGAKEVEETRTGVSNRDAAVRPSAYLKGGYALPGPLSPAKSSFRNATPPVKIFPNPMESGPVAGKESGVMNPEKWCAVCERDGHDSVDCPFEDAF